MIINESNRNNIVRSVWSTETKVLPEKQRPQIQAEQVVKIGPKLGRGRAGIKHRKSQPDADINVSASKSRNIPTIQKVTKDTTDFSVPEQLIKLSRK